MTRNRSLFRNSTLYAGLRPALLALLLLSVLGQTAPAEDTMSAHITLIAFGDDTDDKWYVVNDGVMGGLSSSSITRSDRGTGVFAGMLSLENNGGFASVRTMLDRQNYSPYNGLEVRVRGDGRTYQLRLRTSDRFDGIVYTASFEASTDKWMTVQVPFDKFRPTFRGRVVRDAPPLDTSRIHQLAFMLAEKKPGPFRLEIDFVRTLAP